MVELDGDLRLVDEALDELLVGAELGQDLLDDDRLLEALDLAQLAEEDLAHPPAGEAFQEQVTPEDLRESLRFVGDGRRHCDPT